MVCGVGVWLTTVAGWACQGLPAHTMSWWQRCGMHPLAGEGPLRDLSLPRAEAGPAPSPADGFALLGSAEVQPPAQAGGCRRGDIQTDIPQPVCADLFCFAERQAEELGEYHSPSLVRDFSWVIFSFGCCIYGLVLFFSFGKGRGGKCWTHFRNIIFLCTVCVFKLLFYTKKKLLSFYKVQTEHKYVCEARQRDYIYQNVWSTST